MAFSSSSSSLLLHFKVSIPHTKNPFHRFSSNYCLVPTKIFPKCCSISSKSSTFFKCYSQRQSTEQKNEETEGKNGYQEQVYDFERLFSNLNQATLKREPGSLSSSIFLVAGTTVGAGILAIPAVTQESGFLASAIVCIVCWIYMVVSGLLIAEVNVKTMCELGSGGVSLLVLHFHPLRPSCCLCGSFFRYIDNLHRDSIMGNRDLVFTASWRDLLLWKRTIGAVNGVLVFGIIASFTVLVVVASGDLHWEALLKANFEAAPQSIPIIALSFVYQNVVPVLCTNLEGDLSKVRSAIVFGTAIPLALFLVWDGVILGTITTLGTEADKIADPLQLLRSTNGIVGPIVDIFSLLAIATSYIGFVLGLSDFLADYFTALYNLVWDSDHCMLKLPSGPNRPLPYLLTLVPPLILSLLDPEIFFKALDFAGTYGVLVLFGLLPAAMSWSDRYSESTQTPNLPPLVPGGKITLSLVFGGAALVILSEIVENIAHT
ncbi:uncharacterized protein [Solanum lycopersicum]|uniref:uncharacterized protein isoform X3 n=1 Tax=Solanum lycopersicum TaxID=4081 RepID=UPI00374A0CA8